MIHTDGKRTIANASPRVVKGPLRPRPAAKPEPRDPVAGVIASAERVVAEEAKRLGWSV